MTWKKKPTFKKCHGRSSGRTSDPSRPLSTSSYVPEVGDRHDLPNPVQDMRPFSVAVVASDDEQAKVAMFDPREGVGASPFGVWMPKGSVSHFVNDLRGLVYGGPSRNRLVDAVVSGRGKLLGKGDDGIAFKVGSYVVKVSTTVPFQPFNQGHLSPRQSIERALEQHRVSEAMRREGVPGILPAKVVVHANKAFTIRPFVEEPEVLTRRELDEVAASVEAAHKAGWVFRDALQVGTLRGHVYHFDTGKAGRSSTRGSPDDWRSEESSDVQSLKRLFQKNGERYLTAAEKVNPIKTFEALAYQGDPTTMSAEQLAAARRQILRLDVAIRAYVANHPNDPSVGLWDDPEFHRDEVRLAMVRFGGVPRTSAF